MDKLDKKNGVAVKLKRPDGFHDYDVDRIIINSYMTNNMRLNWTERISLTQSGVDRIKAIAGVYRLIHYDRSKDKYYVHYVGQAEDLNDRLTQRLSENETNECCKKHLDNYICYFRAAAISQQADRNGAEVALYNHYEPSCVDRIPDADPIDINFD